MAVTRLVINQAQWDLGSNSGWQIQTKAANDKHNTRNTPVTFSIDILVRHKSLQN